MHKLVAAFTAAGIMAFGTVASSESLVSDSFESGNMSTTSSVGFDWSNTTSTSVVTATTEVFKTSLLNEPAPLDSNWQAKTGNHSLNFRYNVGKSWVEQRFQIGEAHPEIWMSFWLRVPTNYSHPTVAGASDNQKLFALWMDGYSTKGEGSTVSMEFRGSGGGSSYFYGKISPGGYKGTGGDRGAAPFIEVPGDRGKWMHLVVHAVSETSAGAADGVMEVWRKWEGNAEYVKTHDLKNQPISLSSSVKGFSRGYLMGWANAPYPVTTDFLLDDFELSTNPLFSSSNAPNAPSELVVR
ncbi:hypothetical protein [Marinobacter fonticola]|uniref:hypothetical protein n=1 Tax=Marinobacter fonticola TaxID=2603215 RepID=UPI0011E6A3F8|nr:hypothetical protein [Marinobacter fonticola]